MLTCYHSGFNSAVEAAQNAIRSAKTEAVCNLPNGIGIVKLMGRSAGFIAAHATMASSDVDLCLVPEVPTVLEGEKGCLPYLMRRVRQQGFAVIVVAEGAGEDVLGTSAETDASGNKKLPAIGEFLKKTITEYFAKQGEVATVKYIDPSYMVRSVPANAADSLYCMQLAQNAVRMSMPSNLPCLVHHRVSPYAYSNLLRRRRHGGFDRFFGRSMQQSHGLFAHSRTRGYQSALDERHWPYLGAGLGND
jgi:6-phosphofructokinase